MRASQIYPTSSKSNLFVVTVDDCHYRYFNGRRYYVSKEMQHFITPGQPENNFWCHRIYISCSPRWPLRANQHSTRYSQTSGR